MQVLREGSLALLPTWVTLREHLLSWLFIEFSLDNSDVHILLVDHFNERSHLCRSGGSTVLPNPRRDREKNRCEHNGYLVSVPLEVVRRVACASSTLPSIVMLSILVCVRVV